ncbi:MBOAT, membrane-bound O-acyltransferase family-domain-containing protein [Geopyxis carbonaria]|nr:MBOAT, membrane-bound O-acyltransferase family-domain-containing protein [Geopyxis carbonaria]
MIPFIDLPFIWLSNLLGASKDELKLIFCIIISYPFARLLKQLPDNEPWKKNLFLISVSFFYLVGIFDLWGGIRTLFISAAGAYAIAAYIDGPYMPWIGFVYLMGHMLYSHLYRELYPAPGVVDVTGAQMVLVMKLTSFCWSVYDGRLPEEGLSDFQKDRRLTKLPPLLDYTAYVLYFPALFAGPSFDFREFERWLDCSMFDVVIPDSKSGGTKRKRKIPKTNGAALWKGATGLGWILVFTKLSTIYSAEFALSDTYMEYSFARRVWFIYVFGLVARLKYYGVWTLTDGACILSGLGYNGVDEKGNIKWDRVTNVNAWKLETAENSRAYLENWNMNTNKWLRNYVYLRVTPKGKKPGFRSSMATFGTSALWHGISPGYYLTFVTASLVQTVAKNFRRHVRPIFMALDQKSPGPYKKIYDIFGFLATQIAFSYVVAPFIILGLGDSLRLWGRLWFFVHVGIFASMAFFSSPGKPWLQARQKKRLGRLQPSRTTSLESVHQSRSGPMGLPENPEEDLQELQEEMRQEFLLRKKSLAAKRQAASKGKKAK